jgi:hypothetical protein
MAMRPFGFYRAVGQGCRASVFPETARTRTINDAKNIAIASCPGRSQMVAGESLLAEYRARTKPPVPAKTTNKRTMKFFMVSSNLSGEKALCDLFALLQKTFSNFLEKGEVCER